MQAIQGFPAATRLAKRYADELVDTVELGLRRGRVAADHGFARGYQGIAWALGRYGVPGDRYTDAARAAADLDRPRAPWWPWLVLRVTPGPRWPGCAPEYPRTSTPT